MNHIGKKSFLAAIVLSVVLIVGAAPARQTALDQKQIQPQKQKTDTEVAVEGNNNFAFDLYAGLKNDPQALKPDGNLFFSPYSISTALAMSYAGARTETEKEMSRVLHFTLGQEKQHQAFSRLQIQLNQAHKNKLYQLNTANALWGRTGSNFLPEYIALNRKCYQAEIRELDFLADAEKARQIINVWVENKTQDKIKDLIPTKDALEGAGLVLTNAIYFKGDWQIQFDGKDTRDMPFMVAPDKKVEAPMMFMTEEFNHFADEQVQVLELPYKGRALSMIVLLPRQMDGLADLEKILNVKNLDKWIKGMQKQKLPVYLPRFKMTWGTFELKNTLKTLGMKIPFYSGADFSGIDGTEELFISAVLHKAFVEVNEKGTEAAAATAVVMIRGGGLSFHANHPFVFMIRDNKSGSILFMGRVANPVS
ncbi:serpin family protein [Planctomycetota bacterium]